VVASRAGAVYVGSLSPSPSLTVSGDGDDDDDVVSLPSEFSSVKVLGREGTCWRFSGGCLWPLGVVLLGSFGDT
jgi:hypothetical protein